MRNIVLIGLLLLLFCTLVTISQRTALDDKFMPIYRQMRLLSWKIAGNPSLNGVRKAGKTQPQIKRETICESNEVPRRSATPPTSVHKLRPGDIDIIAGMGDSLTAGNGILASNLLQVLIENRGMSFSIGGQGNWKRILTLPNIIKEFNSNLYGYSLGDSFSTDRASRFNVAELGAMSRDIYYEARILHKRMINDPKVNMKEDWKLVTILIGNNDFCSDMCYYLNPKEVIDLHEKNMVKTLRYLRDNFPRMLVNIVPSPNLILLTKMTKKPPLCETTHPFECPCLIGKPKNVLQYYEKIMLKWQAKDQEISQRDEFNTDTFAVNFQPFTMDIEVPKFRSGAMDYSIFSVDCFHISQKGHALSAAALWNNMLEPHSKRNTKWNTTYALDCPTVEQPYLTTIRNS